MASVSPPPDPLVGLQARFALSRIGGEVRIVDRAEIAAMKSGAGPRTLTLYNRSDGALLMRRFLETQAVSCDLKRVTADFLHDPGTLEYDAVAFDPRPTPERTLNLWTPPPVQPARGDWSVLRSFLRDIICSGDEAVFAYLIGFLAHMLLRPTEKPGIMPVLLGGQGTGKGTLFRLLKAIWQHSTLLLNNADDITGRFNSVLEGGYVVCLDEAIFRGDFKTLDRIKSLITEPEIMIEAKYQPRHSLPSFHRFFAASNHRHFAHVEADDRRFLFLRVSDSRKGDHDYFGRVHSAIADPASIAAFVHYLLALAPYLSNFNVRKRPVTAEHMEQKLQSLRGFDRYWFEVLNTGNLSVSTVACDSWGPGRFVASVVIKTAIESFGRTNRHAEPFTERDLLAALLRLCPSAGKARRQHFGVQHRGYDLPALDAARRDFEKAIGADVDWTEGGDSRNAPAVLPVSVANDCEVALPPPPVSCQLGGQP